MLPLVLLALFAWCAAAFNSAGYASDTAADVYELKVKEFDMRRVAEAVEMYWHETGSFPVSLQALVTAPGYQHVATNLNAWQTLVSVGSLTDGSWTFSRLAVFTRSPQSGAVASYLAKNACGTASFYADTVTWCGSTDSRWYVADTRKYFAVDMTTQQVRMGRLNQKFADYFNKNGFYPKVDAANNPLGPSSISSLASLAGYGGNAKSCSGQYQYLGIPIDCGDMFDIWGGPVGYQFESGAHVIFVSEPPIFDNAGNRVVVAVDRA